MLLSCLLKGLQLGEKLDQPPVGFKVVYYR